ncbi:MAG: hypothetical protein QXS54_08750 [Candidatus Methanomethylicaceae archaeon]
MSQKTRLMERNDSEALYVMDTWSDENYIYFSWEVLYKKGHVDIITEQPIKRLPEIVAKQTFWSRLRPGLVSELREGLAKAGMPDAEIEFTEWDIKLSNSLKTGKGVGKFFSAVSYDALFWTAVGFTATARIKRQ